MRQADTEFVHILVRDGFQGDGYGSPIVMPMSVDIDIDIFPKRGLIHSSMEAPSATHLLPHGYLHSSVVTRNSES